MSPVACLIPMSDPFADRPIRTTEFSTLTGCEQRWWYRYAAEIEEPTVSPALTKGTLWHAAWAEWWENDNHFDGGRMIERVPEDRRGLITPEILDDVIWMVKRYETVYGPTRYEWEMVANEVELEAVVGGLLLQGRADGLIRHIPTNRLYLGEAKSMRDWRRLDILTVDPQLTHYYSLAKAAGYEIDGILYDAAKTYRWKRDEHKHPPAESFQRLFIDRTPEQCEKALEQLAAFASRRSELLGGATPLRNISSMTCGGCAYRAQCYDEIAFPEAEIELVD